MDNLTLLHLAGDTWLAPGPTNVGLYVDGTSVTLIDSGNDKDAGRKILKALGEKGWTLKTIVNTHSNADHIGANNYLQGMTGCEIWATAGEAAFIERPSLEGSLLWGGFPFGELRSKFFQAKPSKVTRIVAARQGAAPWGDALAGAGGLSFMPLPGHFIEMMGVLTPDGILFLGDSLFGEKVLEKHKIPFIYDVRAFKESLDALLAVEASLFVPSHGEVCGSIETLVGANRAKVEAIEAAIVQILGDPATFEEVLGQLCSLYEISLDYASCALDGSTLRSFLSYLKDEGAIDYRFEGTRMTWFKGNRQ